MLKLLFILLNIINYSTSNVLHKQKTEDKIINLNLENSLIIRGEINEETTKMFMNDLYNKKNKDNLYLYLETPGGSVMQGLKIISEIEKYKISCIANTAYSMGFVILQYCDKRYITKHATIMQHQMSYGVSGEKAKIESLVEYIKTISDELLDKQSSRIGINKREFEIKTYNDWWLYGENIIRHNCADKIVDVYCSDELVNSNYIVYKQTFFEESSEFFSRCGLL